MSELGHWEEDSRFPLTDWKYEVGNDDTRLGYHQWVEVKRDNARTSVLIKVDFREMIGNGLGWDVLNEMVDDALTETMSNGHGWTLYDCTTEVEGHEGNTILLRVHGTAEEVD